MIDSAFLATRWSRLIAWGRTPADPHEAIGARAVFIAPRRWALLAAFALLVILRLPRAWLHGRFLDEEGTIFFAYAWHRPAIDALLRSFGGYLNLGANAASLLAARLVRAGVLPLEAAPYVTMSIASLVQMLPAALILTGRARWLTNRWAVLAALLILAIAPMTEEVFSNVLHIQFQLAMGAALILALDVPRERMTRIGYGTLLWLAPLCGPGAIVVLPFFALRTLIDREPARLAQTVAFGAGAALQLLVFFHPSPVRGDLVDPVTLMAMMFVRLFALPFSAEGPANALGKAVHGSYLAHGIGWWCAAAAGAVYFGALIALALRDRRDGTIWLVLPAIMLAMASFGGGMIVTDAREWFSVGAGQRYNFLPLVLLSFTLIAFARRPRGRYRGACIALVLATLVTGAIGYPQPLKELSTGPAWSNEVAAWRRDHHYRLVTWPTVWSVDLSDRDLPCLPTTAPAAAHDPSYCEGAWLARIARPGPARADRLTPQAIPAARTANSSRA